MLAECCDVMVAHSPPLFTPPTSQPELSVLYQNLRLVMTQKQQQQQQQQQLQQQSPLSVRRLNRPPNLSNTEDTAGSPNKPRRPCLVTRSDSDGSIGSSSDENEPSSPTKNKKKVVFADDRGLSLTQVRLMNEPSNQPPKLMGVAPYLSQSPNVAQSAANNGKQLTDQWQLQFPQPASSYLDFRKRLDESGVSLENVIVKSQERRIVGTVKVRNLSYDKEVFVRCTHDKWATFEDTLCTYVLNNTISSSSSSNGGGGGGGSAANPVQNVTAIYDTFSFRLTLPADATAMEFAVCYKGGDFEFWDNNDGANYCLINNARQAAAQQSAVAATMPNPAPSPRPALIEFEQKSSAVPFFGAQSRQNSWSSIWREQKNDTYTYW